MKSFIVIGGLLVLVASLSGCGSDAASRKDAATKKAEVTRKDAATIKVEASKGLFGTITYAGGRIEPGVHVSGGPPPKKTFVRDVEVGDGPMARRGDTVAVYYYGVNYRTGVKVHYSWGPGPPLEINLQPGSAWEKSILGMRAGGLREAVIPSRLAFKEGAIDYITELVAVNPPG